jgi:hypothetical protein
MIQLWARIFFKFVIRTREDLAGFGDPQKVGYPTRCSAIERMTNCGPAAMRISRVRAAASGCRCRLPMPYSSDGKAKVLCEAIFAVAPPNVPRLQDVHVSGFVVLLTLGGTLSSMEKVSNRSASPRGNWSAGARRDFLFVALPDFGEIQFESGDWTVTVNHVDVLVRFTKVAAVR